MPKFNLGKVLEGTAYGVLNEILGEFRSKDGYAKPSRYEVVILPPQGTRARPKGALNNIFAKVMEENTGEGTTRKTGLVCESISFPGRNLDTMDDTNIYGPIRSVVNGYSYGDITGVFQCSSDLKEKKFFETWQRLAYNPQTWSMGYYDDYTGALEIHQLDEDDKRRYGVQLIECYPVNIAEQSLSYQPATEVQKVSVTFKYRYWKNLTDEADLPVPLRNRIEEVVVNSVERNIRAAIPRVLSRL
tara:strand:- start:120 stop:854 length:735 start_codon:yes stop_codon:yes gene_type:complete